MKPIFRAKNATNFRAHELSFVMVCPHTFVQYFVKPPLRPTKQLEIFNFSTNLDVEKALKARYCQILSVVKRKCFPASFQAIYLRMFVLLWREIGCRADIFIFWLEMS